MGGRSRSAIAKDAQAKSTAQLLDYQNQQKEQKVILDKQKQEYKDMKFTNPYENMENPFEDLTVNQQQAQFQAQQGAQQRANILGGLKGAAGGSGIAGLAQAMANQGQLQTQQISASIGQQESRNQALMAKGAAAADMAERGGAAALQQAESSRTSTLLGMEQGAMAGINQGVQSAYANQQSAIGMEAEMKAANQQMWGSIIGGVAGAAGTVMTGGAESIAGKLAGLG